MSTFISLLVGFTLPFVLLFLIARSLIRAANDWSVVAEGVVASIESVDVPPLPADESGLRLQPLPAVRTTITLANGERHVLDGYHGHRCKEGDRIIISRNKLGDLRVERSIQGAG